MTNFQQWRQRNNRAGVNVTSRAITTWSRIRRQSFTLKLARGDVDVPDQTVRVNMRANNRQAEGDGGGSSSVTGATVIGVKDHPDDSVPDTDIQKGDVFLYGGLRFNVMIVIEHPGRIEARCEAMS